MPQRPVSPRPATIAHALSHWAQVKPSQTAYTFLDETGRPSETLSFLELRDRALAVAHRLIAEGRQGERVLLLFPPGLDFITAFFGCLYAGVVAVPCYPHLNARGMAKLDGIIQDADARAALSTTALTTSLRSAKLPVPCWAVDDLAAGSPEDLSPDADGLAFLQYTSGSTSAPKGVMVSHANIVANQEGIRSVFKTTEQDVVLGWLPVYHDMGLIGTVLHPVYMGLSCVLMAPTTFIRRPMAWLEAISTYGATMSGGPNFAYDLCARQATVQDLARLNLGTWRLAFSGAEPVRAQSLDRFASAYQSAGFRAQAFLPCYGMAETTLIATGVPSGEGAQSLSVDAGALAAGTILPASTESTDARRLVSCGPVIPEHRLAVVDPVTLERVADGRVGEIWVAGPSVSSGYWRRRELTQQVFGQRLGDEGGYLRTGDLGALRDGQVYVTGRLKDLLIIRGRNHYPQDIEETVATVGAPVREGAVAVTATEVGGQEQLVVVAEVGRHCDPSTVKWVTSAIRRAVAEEHGVSPYAVVLLKAGHLPKTTSGKIQRSACRQGFESRSFEAFVYDVEETVEAAGPSIRERVAAAAPDERVALLERYVRERLARKLNRRLEDIPAEQGLFALALDSLGVTELKVTLEQEFGVGLALSLMRSDPSPRAIARFLVERLDAPSPSEAETDAPVQVEDLSDSEVDRMLAQMMAGQA